MTQFTSPIAILTHIRIFAVILQISRKTLTGKQRLEGSLSVKLSLEISNLSASNASFIQHGIAAIC